LLPLLLTVEPLARESIGGGATAPTAAAATSCATAAAIKPAMIKWKRLVGLTAAAVAQLVSAAEASTIPRGGVLFRPARGPAPDVSYNTIPHIPHISAHPAHFRTSRTFPHNPAHLRTIPHISAQSRTFPHISAQKFGGNFFVDFFVKSLGRDRVIEGTRISNYGKIFGLLLGKNRLIRAVGATSRGRDRRGKEGREERGERR
jgi:hypothetical protein